jgi:hypothetical protein
MSSKKAKRNLLRYDFKYGVHERLKVAGEFESLKGIIVNSYNPSWVLKIVNGIWSLCISNLI